MASTGKVKVYKCPSCGGAVRFDPAAKALVCGWCDSKYDSGELEPKQVSSELQGYLCPECGAELMSDDYIAADTCPYCGNNEVAPHRFEGDFRPDFIIPFSITKQTAIDEYEAYVEEKGFLPDDYLEEDRIVSVQGTYVPFWLQDGVIDFDYTLYTTYRAGYNIPWTRNHRIAGTYEFSRVPTDGSARMPDDMMDSLEPYNFDALEPFSTEYLPGFIAERYSVSLEKVAERFDKRIKAATIAKAKDQIALADEEKDDEIVFGEDASKHTLQRGKSAQILLPVWLIVVSYQNEKYLVGVNGQSGKVAVNLPIDEKKQRNEALKETGKTALVLSPFFLAVNVVWLAFIVGIIYSWGFEGIINSFTSLFTGNVSSGLPALGIIFFMILITLSIPMFRYRTFSKTKESVTQSMQNVEESTDISSYGTMTTTTKSVEWEGETWKTVGIIIAIFLIVFICLIPVIIDTFPGALPPSDISSTPDRQSLTDRPSASVDPDVPSSTFDVVKQFIEDYNSSPYSSKELVIGEKFSPQDENNGHYHKELGEKKYEGSEGWVCNAEDIEVEIITTEPKSAVYGDPKKSFQLRVYASGSEEDVIEFLRAAAHVLEPDLSDEAIMEGIRGAADLTGLVYIKDSGLIGQLKDGEAVISTNKSITSK